MTISGGDLHGVIAASVTPFDQNEDLDTDALRKVAAYAAGNGANGIMTTGGTGEFPSLTRQEKQDVTRTVVKEVAGRIPVIAGTAACSTRETIELSRDAKEAGADAVIVTAPYYFPLPQSALYDHYRAVARDAGLPVVVYNNPTYTGNNLAPTLILSLLGLPGVIGLKQSNADLGDLVEILSRADRRSSICTGIDSQFLPALCVGASGIYSTAASVIPSVMAQIYSDFRSGKSESALRTHLKAQRFNRFLEYEPGYVAPCKEGLRLLGFPAGPVRRPLPELSTVEKEQIRAALAELELPLRLGAQV
jgi:4-hydroxy-tetrahydrodipicolinate synthase